MFDLIVSLHNNTYFLENGCRSEVGGARGQVEGEWREWKRWGKLMLLFYHPPDIDSKGGMLFKNRSAKNIVSFSHYLPLCKELRAK